MKRLALLLLVLAACGAPPAETVLTAGQIPQREPESYTRWERGDEFNPPTTARPTSTTQARASRSAPRAYGVLLVSSTAYCLTGTMANGQRVYAGAVAMNGVPFGARYRILDGPLAGTILTVADRIGHSSQFDIATPGDCAAARQYGRRTITIERVDG